MTKRGTIEIGTKLLGLYCLMTAIVAIPVALMAFFTKVPNKVIYVVLSCTIPVLYVLLAMLFLSKGSVIASLLTGESSTETTLETEGILFDSWLSLWVILIGLFYFVSSSTSVISQLICSSLPSYDSYHSSKLIAQILIFGMSLIFIFRSERIVKLISRMKVRNIR